MQNAAIAQHQRLHSAVLVGYHICQGRSQMNGNVALLQLLPDHVAELTVGGVREKAVPKLYQLHVVSGLVQRTDDFEANVAGPDHGNVGASQVWRILSAPTNRPKATE